MSSHSLQPQDGEGARRKRDDEKDSDGKVVVVQNPSDGGTNFRLGIATTAAIVATATTESAQTITTNDALAATAAEVPSWNTFVRQGTRFKFFMEDTLHQVRIHGSGLLDGTSSNKNKNKRIILDDSDNNEDDNADELRRNKRRKEDREHAMQLAREKTGEVLVLQRKLKEIEAHVAALEATNSSLREEAAAVQQRLERTTQALRIAGSNSSKARQDADAAEANVATLAQSFQDLQTMMEETKRAAQLLLTEQQQVSEAANAANTLLLKKDIDLARAHKEIQTLRASQKNIDKERSKWAEERAGLECRLEENGQELDQLRRNTSERHAIERARKQRADNVEQEWRQAQKLLVEATAGQEKAEQTRNALQETIDELTQANQDFHEQLKKYQEVARKEKERLNESLTKVEKEAQMLRIKKEEMEEEIHRHHLDSAASEKQIAQLKNHCAHLERRVKEAGSQSIVSAEVNYSDNNFNINTPGSSAVLSAKSFLTVDIPPLHGVAGSTLAGNEILSNQGGASATNSQLSSKTCCICFKESFGLMKSCQCGNDKCEKRAHMSCATRIYQSPSVSHPVTPALRVPTIFCGTSSFASKD